MAGRYVRPQEVEVLGGTIALVVNRSPVETLGLRYHVELARRPSFLYGRDAGSTHLCKLFNLRS